MLHADLNALQAGALHAVAKLSAAQLQHLHVFFAGPEHTLCRQQLQRMRQHYEQSQQYKGKV